MGLSAAPTSQGRPSPLPGAPQVSAKVLVSLPQLAPAAGLARGRWRLAVQPAAPLRGSTPPGSCVDSRACGLGGWRRSRLPPLLRRWSRAPGRPRGSALGSKTCRDAGRFLRGFCSKSGGGGWTRGATCPRRAAPCAVPDLRWDPYSSWSRTEATGTRPLLRAPQAAAAVEVSAPRACRAPGTQSCSCGLGPGSARQAARLGSPGPVSGSWLPSTPRTQRGCHSGCGLEQGRRTETKGWLSPPCAVRAARLLRAPAPGPQGCGVPACVAASASGPLGPAAPTSHW